MLERDVAPGVHRVEDAFVNFYLVEEEGRITIVDAGHPRSWDVLQQALRELGRTTQDVAALVLTHGHFDHVGFARQAHEKLGIPVYAPEGEQEVVDEPWDYDHERARIRYTTNPGFLKVFAAMGAKGALFVRGLDDTVAYAPGTTLPVPGRPVAVATPGHTHAHTSLHLPDRDALVAGDAVVMLCPYTTRTGPVIVAGAATADSEQALRSLDVIAATGATHVLTGHGPVWHEGAEAAADRARAAGPA